MESFGGELINLTEHNAVWVKNIGYGHTYLCKRNKALYTYTNN